MTTPADRHRAQDSPSLDMSHPSGSQEDSELNALMEEEAPCTLRRLLDDVQVRLPWQCSLTEVSMPSNAAKEHRHGMLDLGPFILRRHYQYRYARESPSDRPSQASGGKYRRNPFVEDDRVLIKTTLLSCRPHLPGPDRGGTPIHQRCQGAANAEADDTDHATCLDPMSLAIDMNNVEASFQLCHCHSYYANESQREGTFRHFWSRIGSPGDRDPRSSIRPLRKHRDSVSYRENPSLIFFIFTLDRSSEAKAEPNPDKPSSPIDTFNIWDVGTLRVRNGDIGLRDRLLSSMDPMFVQHQVDRFRSYEIIQEKTCTTFNLQGTFKAGTKQWKNYPMPLPRPFKELKRARKRSQTLRQPQLTTKQLLELSTPELRERLATMLGCTIEEVAEHNKKELVHQISIDVPSKKDAGKLSEAESSTEPKNIEDYTEREIAEIFETVGDSGLNPKDIEDLCASAYRSEL